MPEGSIQKHQSNYTKAVYFRQFSSMFERGLHEHTKFEVSKYIMLQNVGTCSVQFNAMQDSWHARKMCVVKLNFQFVYVILK